MTDVPAKLEGGESMGLTTGRKTTPRGQRLDTNGTSLKFFVRCLGKQFGVVGTHKPLGFLA